MTDKVVSPFFPVVSPNTLDGVLQTYPVTTRQTLEGFRRHTQAINGIINSLGNQRRNYLINGSFACWQRGSSFNLSTVKYCADRWRCDPAGGTLLATRVPVNLGQGAPSLRYCLYFKRPIATAKQPDITNTIEGVCSLAGSESTLSFWSYATSNIGVNVSLEQNFGTGGSPSPSVYTTPIYVQFTPSWGYTPRNITIPSIDGKTFGTNGDDFLRLHLTFPANVTFEGYLAAVQVEEGDEATPFERLPLGDELVLCQRYFEKSYNLDNAPGSPWLLNSGEHFGTTHPTGIFRGGPSFKVRKRTVPNVKTYDAAGVSGLSYYDSSIGPYGAWAGGGAWSIGPTASECGFYGGHNIASSIETQFSWTADADYY